MRLKLTVSGPSPGLLPHNLSYGTAMKRRATMAHLAKTLLRNKQQARRHRRNGHGLSSSNWVWSAVRQLGFLA